MLGLALASTVAALRAEIERERTARFVAYERALHAEKARESAEQRAYRIARTAGRLRRRLRTAAESTPIVAAPAPSVTPPTPATVPLPVQQTIVGWDTPWAREDVADAFEEQRQAAGGDWDRVVFGEVAP